ncbi:hypothetical protein [Aeromonas veronii]|uniref:hypothetical protein n=1 Tax=Aeromonas veronii TaxID=654 RepID=UPI001F0A7F0B|nr:hypothetical protein [Aeromonas veronii]
MFRCLDRRRLTKHAQVRLAAERRNHPLRVHPILGRKLTKLSEHCPALRNSLLNIANFQRKDVALSTRTLHVLQPRIYVAQPGQRETKSVAHRMRQTGQHVIFCNGIRRWPFVLLCGTHGSRARAKHRLYAAQGRRADARFCNLLFTGSGFGAS